MAKIAEISQNNEIFVVVSSQMPKGRNILCQETIIWCRETKEMVRGNLGAHERGRKWLKISKNEKIQAFILKKIICQIICTDTVNLCSRTK